MSLVLDAGALIAYERGNRTVRAFLDRAQRQDDSVRTSAAVVAQVWRNGSRQASLARLITGVDQVDLSANNNRRIGALLAGSKTADVVDAALVDLIRDGDEVLTSDPADIVHLLTTAGITAIVTRI
jgi:hypothetical protein